VSGRADSSKDPYGDTSRIYIWWLLRTSAAVDLEWTPNKKRYRLYLISKVLLDVSYSASVITSSLYFKRLVSHSRRWTMQATVGGIISPTAECCCCPWRRRSRRRRRIVYTVVAIIVLMFWLTSAPVTDNGGVSGGRTTFFCLAAIITAVVFCCCCCTSLATL